MLYGAVGSAVQCYTVLRSAIQCYTVLRSAIQCYTVLYSAIQCYTVLLAVLCSAIQYYAALYGAMQCCLVFTVRCAAVHSAARTVHLLILFLEHRVAVHESWLPSLPARSQPELRSILGAANTHS